MGEGPLAPVVRLVSLALEPGARSVPLPVETGFRAGISLAAAGDMALSRRAHLPHHAAFLERLDGPPFVPWALRQVHSRRVILVEAGAGPDAPAEADGMITARADALLTVTVADCLPVILLDTATGAFGLVHSGWKGTGIAGEALRLMHERFGTRAQDVQVIIGPGIGPCCYTVPEERAARFAAEFGPAAVVRDRGPRLDLRGANVRLLRDAGVGTITVVQDCTSCTPALGSFRRQGPEAYSLMLAYAGRA